MTIFVTKHAMQRRPNSRIFEKKTIQLWMQYFIEKFNIIWMTKNGLYTIKSKDEKLLIVFDKNKEDVTVITYYGFGEEEEFIWDKKEEIVFKLKLNTQPNKIQLHRIDEKKNVRKCGFIIKRAKGFEFQIKQNFIKKYDNFKIKFNKIEDMIENKILYKDKFDRIFLV